MSTTFRTQISKSLTWVILIIMLLGAGQTASAQTGNRNQSPAMPFPAMPASDSNDKSLTMHNSLGPGDSGSGYIAGADWLLSQQQPSGCFPWTAGAATCPSNVQGTTARGTLMAYVHTGQTDYLDAAIANGDYLVPNYPLTYTDGDPRFSTYDPLYLEELSQVSGDSSYSNFIQSFFWDKLSTGTYGEANDMDAVDFGAYVVNGRTSQGIVELSPWDLAGTAIGAHVAGETAIRDALMGAILAGLEATTASDTDYDIIGLAGAIWASAETGYNLDPASGRYASANSTSDLAVILAGLQRSSDGAWLYNTTADSLDVTSGDLQTTAFAILALESFDSSTYLGQMARGAAFLRSLQQTNGQFLIYPSASPTASGSVESHAEALYSLVTIAPSIVYVDDNWTTGINPGADPDGAGPAIAYGYDAFATIQEGVDAVTSGGTVYVAAGAYIENILITKSLALAGAGQASTFLYPAVSNPICSPGSLCGGAASNVILTQASDIVIHDLTIDGDNSGLTSGIVRDGADLDARNGIIENTGGFDNLEVYNVTIKNIYLRALYASSGGSDFHFHHNTIENVQGEYASIAVFNFGGSGIIEYNTVSKANDAIAANHSRGTQFTNNIITDSGSGIHTDNAGDGGGTSDLIQDNDVSNCTTGGYGIFVFVPYLAHSVDNNTITNCDVGLSAWGQGAAVTTSFTKNVVTGPAKAPGSVGAYITTDWISWGYSDISVSFTDNTITDFETGVYFTGDQMPWNPEPYEAKTINATFSNNSIFNNTNGADRGADGIYNLNMEYNWWGNSSGPYDSLGSTETPPCSATTAADLNSDGTGNSVGEGIDYCPWIGIVVPTDVYVDDDWAGLSDGTMVSVSGVYHIIGHDAFDTIQEGIGATASGGTVYVATGTYVESVDLNKNATVSVSGDITLDGSLTIQQGIFNAPSGNMQITGNFLRSGGTFNHNSGLVTFNGASLQTIGGATFYDLTLDNTSGGALSADLQVNGTLTLTNGRLTLGTSNLTLEASASIAGSFDADHMLVADDTGELRMQVNTADPPSMTFPVGDNTDTAEYSPAQIDCGSVSGSGYIAMRLVDSAHPSNLSTPRLTRYWTVTQSGLSAFTCDVAFDYLDPGDLDDLGSSTEADLWAAKYDSGSGWTTSDTLDESTNQFTMTGITSFSDFTGTPSAPTAVTLTNFNATPVIKTIRLDWETANELTLVGFDLYRSTEPNGTRQKLGVIQAKQPGSLMGDSYEFIDYDVQPGVTYYYWLEPVETEPSSMYYMVSATGNQLVYLPLTIRASNP